MTTPTLRAKLAARRQAERRDLTVITLAPSPAAIERAAELVRPKPTRPVAVAAPEPASRRAQSDG